MALLFFGHACVASEPDTKTGHRGLDDAGGLGDAGLADAALPMGDGDAAVASRSLTGGASFQNGLAGYAGTTDTYLRERERDKQFGAAQTCEVGFDASGLHDTYCLLAWDVSTVPSGARVLSASISLHAIDGSMASYGLYGMRRAWDEASATWLDARTGERWQSDGADGALDRGPSIGSVSASSGARSIYTLDQAGIELVQSWVDGELNAGVQIASREATDWIAFASSEHPNIEWRPRLVIRYEQEDSGTSDAPGADCAWHAFQDEVSDYDPVQSRLCRSFADPFADERYFIDCRIEGAAPNSAAAAPKDELTVMTWNMERNYTVVDQIRAIKDGVIKAPDVILAGEVDRGCGRSAKVNGAHEFAQALNYHYVFGVEFVELVGPETDTPCEHGQAIFSRYPLGNVNLLRHTPSGNDEYNRAEQPRVGTRVDLEADVLVGKRCVRVASVHYDDKVEEEPARTLQAIETAERGHEFPVQNYVIGGDMNTIFYFQDPSPTSRSSPAAKALWDRGYYDVHNGVPNRITVPFPAGSVTVSAIVDLLWVRDPSQIKNPGACSEQACGGLSDHLPQWFTLKLK